MIEGAGAANGGIVLTYGIWSSCTFRMKRCSRYPEMIVSVELNDGTFVAPWSLHEDTVNHRSSAARASLT